MVKIFLFNRLYKFLHPFLSLVFGVRERVLKKFSTSQQPKIFIIRLSENDYNFIKKNDKFLHKKFGILNLSSLSGGYRFDGF